MSNFGTQSPCASQARRNYRLKHITCCVMLACSELAHANPTGPQIIQGNVQIQGLGGNSLKVTNSPGSIIHWQGFSVGAGQVTQFAQQSASSAVLNRVVGSDISQIQGQLLSNGRVFLINPAGIVVGAGGVIDTAGFVGSTLNMTNGDFLAGKLRFQGASGVVRNEGSMRASGDIYLIAPAIENAGVIRSDNGSIVLAAGKSVTITSPTLDGVQFTLQAPSDSAINLGTMEATTAVAMFAGTLRHSADIRAGGLSVDAGGRVALVAQKDLTTDAGSRVSASGASGGNITLQAGGTMLVGGQVEVRGSTGKGGAVHLLGERVGVIGSAIVDVSGETGGGTILVGGDYQGKNLSIQNAQASYFGAGSTLRADATGSGDGGKVILWSDGSTRAYGRIFARGGARSGNGGFVETSGKEWLDFAALADTSAVNGSRGTVLLDPRFIDVNDSGGTAYNAGANNLFASNVGGTSVITAASINAQTSNVALEANTDITFTSAVNIASRGVQLTASAGRSILVNNDIRANDANITLTANHTRAAPGDRLAGDAQLTMAPGTTIDAGTGIVRLGIGQGVAGATSGDITIANLNGASVSVLHNGPSADGRIVRAGSFGGVAPSITVPNNGAVHLEIGPAAGGTHSGIGIQASAPFGANPIQITAGTGNTVILESHYEGGGSGIFIDAASNVQIGGASAVYNGIVKGVQALAPQGGAVPPGPVRITSTGTITQQAEGIPPTNEIGICGASANANALGGPVCAGTTDAVGAFVNRSDSVTLRARDMTLQSAVTASSVVLLPNAGGTISPGSAGGATASLYLTQSEIDRITTDALRIGERVESGDPSASGNIVFGSGIAAPGSASIAFRTGGTITASGAATDIATANADIALHTRGDIGATAAGRLKINPGTGRVDPRTIFGGIHLEQSAGDLNFANYGFSVASAGAPPVIQFATTNGNMTGDFGATGAGVFTFTAGGTGNIAFTGTNSISGFGLTLNPGGATTFDSGNKTISAPVTTSRPISVGGGTVHFNNTVTTTGGNGTLTITAGAANFNAGSSIAGTTTLSGGTLGGTADLTLNAPFNWSGGTVSGAARLVTNGISTLSGGAKTLTSRRWDNFGTVNWTGGAITLSNAAATINNRSGAIWNIQNTVDSNVVGAGTFNNLAGGTINADATAAAGGNSIHPALVNHTGTLNLNQGDLNFDGSSTINFAGPINFANGTRILGAIGGSTLNFNSGVSMTVAGAAQIAVNNWTMNVNANLSLPSGIALNQLGGVINANAGLTVANGASYSLSGGTLNILAPGSFTLNDAGTTNLSGGIFNNAGTLNWNAGTLAISGAPTFTNAAGGVFNIAAGAGNLTATGTQLITNNGALNSAGNHQVGGGAGARLDNAGSVNVTNGTLTLLVNDVDAHGALGDTGSYNVSGGATLAFSNAFRDFLPASAVGGAGTIQFDSLSGGVNTIRGAFNPAATSIAGDTTVNFGSPAAVQALNMTGGTLNITSGGIVQLTGSGAKNVSGGAISDSGILVLGGTADLRLSAPASLQIARTGVLDIRSDVGIQAVTGMPALSNVGTLRKSGGAGTSAIGTVGALAFANSGRLDAQTGTLQLASANQTFHGGTSFTGAGTNLITADSAFNGAITSANLNLQSGTQTFSGDATLVGTTAWSGGSMAGPVTIPANATLNVTGAAVKRVDGGTLSNNGTINLTGDGALLLQNGAVVRNAGLFDIGSDAQIAVFPGGPVSTFSNIGTLRKSGGVESTFQPALTNAQSGTIHVSAGTLRVTGGFPVNDGTINTDAGTVFATNNAALTNSSTGTIKGNGTIDLGGALLTNEGVVAPGASPGTLAVNGDYTQGPAGTLAIELAGPVQGVGYDLLQVTGAANLGGTLEVATSGGFVPAGGERFAFLTYGSRTGDFARSNYAGTAPLQAAPGARSYEIVAQQSSRQVGPDVLRNRSIEENERLRENFVDLTTASNAMEDPRPTGREICR